ncbi:carbohydrate porin [Pseudanabaena sp. FACHB-1998]|uniref:iron uptake porin n=1 Tax=Pseudanabaena sp. FACHB-1998 TaxID=2692858 RepID=UPI001681B1F8|nr:iron uptake porin [Pseudanabaena sp. FACHB-1998]MBD2175618.1 carbohydrate porin [Pseudanabaena sp. FACHB-1998]
MKAYYLALTGSLGLLAMAGGNAAIATVPNSQSDPLAQNVTSVSQLSDVKTTDWAFTSLQSLVERYGCIAGYPDRTYRGQAALSRYEFAAGLNACLDKINEIISSGLADKVSKEDLASLQKLQEEFASELSTLRGRVDSLEAKTSKLEERQFSTTTKLTGQAIFAITGGGSSTSPFLSSTNALAGNTLNLPPDNGLPIAGSGNVNTTVNARVRLDLNTSFTGSDLLLTRLEVGNGGGTAGSVLGNPLNEFSNVGFNTFRLDYAGNSSNFTLAKLRYDFNLGKDVRVSLGPVMHVYDHVDKNSFANDEAADFSSTFFINNPLVVLINPQTGGAGGAIDWNPNGGDFNFRALYLAANAGTPSPVAVTAGSAISRNAGFGGDPYQGTVELEYSPKRNGEKGAFSIRLQYTRGTVNNLDFNTGGINAEWAFSKGVAIFGRYGFGSIDNRGTAVVGNNVLGDPTFNFSNASAASGTTSSFSPQTFAIGLAFPDLLKQGSLAAIAVGQPFIESKVGNSTQTNLEAFIRFPITNNITITPDLQLIFNANNNSANSTVTVGTLRTVFSF